MENMDAQNSNLNRGGYKAMENSWADHLRAGDKVFVNVDTFKPDNSDRPSAYMGYSIIEHPDGSREADAFSYANESREEQTDWEALIQEESLETDIEAAISDMEYSDEL